MPITAIAFSPDTTQLATVGGDTRNRGGSEAKLWDVKEGKLIRSIASLPNPGIDVSFSPDGKMLAIAVQSGIVSLWDAATGSTPFRLEGENGPIKNFGPHYSAHSIAFSSDGKFLAGASDRVVYIWNARTGEFLRSCTLLNTPSTVGTLDVGNIAFSPDSRILALGDNRSYRTVTLYRVQ